MLSINHVYDIQKMKEYYRTSDMLNLLYFFPKLSPIKDLTIIENIDDYLRHQELFAHFTQNRVDTLKGRIPILGIENSGKNNSFYDTLIKVKEKDPYGVLVLFNINSNISERYERYAGISVGVNLENLSLLMQFQKVLMEEKYQKVFVFMKDILYHGMI